MTVDVAISLLSLVLTAIVAAGGFVTWLMKVQSRQTIAEQRIEIIWDFLMKGAIQEAVRKGFGVANSPLTAISEDCRKLFSPELVNDLKTFYEHNGKLQDIDYELQLHKQFGERIWREICMPHDLQRGACLPIAVVISQEPR